MNIKVINAGNCMLCGKEIRIVIRRASNKLPNIFFCPRCEHRVNKEADKENEDADSN